jgi:hypothetical protein
MMDKLHWKLRGSDKNYLYSYQKQGNGDQILLYMLCNSYNTSPSWVEQNPVKEKAPSHYKATVKHELSWKHAWIELETWSSLKVVTEYQSLK